LSCDGDGDGDGQDNNNNYCKDRLTPRQDDLIAFSLVYLWTTLLDARKHEFGGPNKFTLNEIEVLFSDLGLNMDMIIESKLDILAGRV